MVTVQTFFNIAGFLIKSIIVGLAAAAVAILITSRSGSVPDSSPSAYTVDTLRASFASAVERTAPAVVSILVDRVAYTRDLQVERDIRSQSFTGRARLSEPRLIRRKGLGSGVIVRPDGYIVTNNHVIADARNIQVALWNGDIVLAEVVGTDWETDLAVLKIDVDEDLPTVQSSSEQPLRVGDVVLAIGNPLGLGKTVTMGIVSATGRSKLGISIYQRLIQTDAAINQGNSGGALVSSDGQLVGINARLLSDQTVEGIGFAIPMDTVEKVMESIITHGKVRRGWLGIEMDDGSDHPTVSARTSGGPGVVISQVYPNTPGDWAGLQPGDYVTQFDHRAIPDLETMYEMIADSPPASSVDIEYWREGQAFQTKAKLRQRPDNMSTSG